jgi:hypothetical protein
MNLDQFQVLTSEETTIVECSKQVDTSLTDSTETGSLGNDLVVKYISGNNSHAERLLCCSTHHTSCLMMPFSFNLNQCFKMVN